MQPVTVLWIFSLWGYMWLVSRKKLPFAFAPLLSMSLLTLATYLLGLAGWLKYGSVVLISAGAALGVCGVEDCLRRRSMREPLGFVLFLIPCVLLALRYHDALLVMYDDFSHWGTRARHMLTAHRFPTAADPLITFQSYPPGAACWIYYACRFVGLSDGLMLCAQAWLTLAGFWTLFGLVRKGNAAQLTAAAAVAVMGLSLFQGTASLMVDNLLAAQATAVFVLAVWSRKSSRYMAELTVAPIALLMLIKDTGLLLAAVLWLGIGIYTVTQRRIKRKENFPIMTYAGGGYPLAAIR